MGATDRRAAQPATVVGCRASGRRATAALLAVCCPAPV